MRIKEGFQLRDVAGTIVVVPAGAVAEHYSNMLMLNGVSAFLWKQMQQDTTEEMLCNALLAEYEVEPERASAAVCDFIEKLRQEKILVE